MAYISRDATEQDLTAALPIWKHYVEESLLSFETFDVTLSWLVDQYQRIKVAKLPYIVTFEGEKLVGWAFLKPFSSQSIYRYNAVAESWVHPRYLNKGVGQYQQKLLLSRFDGLPIRNIIVMFTEQQESRLADFGLNFPGLIELGKLDEIVEKAGALLTIKVANLVLGDSSTAPKL